MAEGQRSKGDRKPDDWLGCIMIRSIHPGPRPPFECYEFISGGGWQPQVAGGGTYPFSPQRSPQLSPPPSISALCHRFSPLSSIQPSVIDSAIDSLQVVGGSSVVGRDVIAITSVGGRRREVSIAPPGSSHALQRTDATQSRPYPMHRFALTPGGRWQPQVAGGGTDPLSPQRSPPFSPPFSPPPSIQPSVIDSAIHSAAMS